MSNNFQQKSEFHDHQLKQKRVVFAVTITHNAVPASKVQSVDIPGVVYLRNEGQTAACDAVESLTGQVTAPVDASGTFAIMLDDQVSKIYKSIVTPSSGTIAATALISTGGRFVLNCDSSLDLSAVDLTCTVELEYMGTK